MQLTLLELLLVFATSFLITSWLTPIMRSTAIRLQVFDNPNQPHKTHRNPVPYLGGVAVAVGVVAVTLGAVLLRGNSNTNLELAMSVIAPAIFMSAIGLVDDFKQLEPWPRFVAQNIIAMIATTALIGTNTLGLPLGILPLDFGLTLFWLVGVTNSINFFDNIDGGSSGTVAISSFALALVALWGNQFFISAISLVVSGATLGFLFWNKPPARIYLGDAGALFLGILMAALTIRIDSPYENFFYSASVPFFLLAIPILDTTTVVISRLLKGISPFKGGRDHLSHMLMRTGITKRRTIFILWAWSAGFALIPVCNLYFYYFYLVQFQLQTIIVGTLCWFTLLVYFVLQSFRDKTKID